MERRRVAPAHDTPLRVGVVLGAGPQPRWVADLLHEVATGQISTLALAVRPSAKRRTPVREARGRWRTRFTAGRSSERGRLQLRAGV